MEKKPTISQELEMQKYVMALRAKIQSRAEQLEQTCKDKENCRFAKLQDEIVALADLYRHYYYEIFTEANVTELHQLDNIEQIEKIFTTAKAQMIAGEIDRTHLIKVAEKARQNLQLVCQVGKIAKYADMLLAEEQKDKPEENMEL